MNVVVLSLALVLLAVGCGPTTYEVRGTPLAVGVDGKITVQEIEGGNHLVDVELRHLPPPGRLPNGATVYCLWIAPTNERPSFESVLELDEGARVGKARATTPAHRFEVRVTAERSRTPVAPSDQTVIRQRVSD